MSYLTGFVLAVKTARLDDYKALSERMRVFLVDHGATQYVEARGDGLKWGEATSFPRAVQAQEDETVVFSWIRYPDKATADAAGAAMMAADFGDDMPFDVNRMIYGGFETFLEWTR